MDNLNKKGRMKGLAPWKIIGRSQIVDASPWLRLWKEIVRLPDGRLVSDFYWLEQPDYVVVFALSKIDEVIGIWHYKHGPRSITLGLPAGYVAEGELPLEAAKRELLEETGNEADQWVHLGSFIVDGNRGGGYAHCYMAYGLLAVAEPSPKDLEEIRVETIKLEALAQYLRDGSVVTLGVGAAIALGLNLLRSPLGQKVFEV